MFRINNFCTCIIFAKDAKSLREKELKTAEKKLAAAKSKSEESTKQTKLKTQVIIIDIYSHYSYFVNTE